MTRRTLNNTQRRFGVTAIALASASMLAGCGQLSNDFTTDLHYDAADGVSKTVGTLDAENLLIVNDGKEKSGDLHGLVYNSGDKDQNLTISINGQNVDVKIPAHKSVRLDGKPNGNGDAKVSAVKLNNLGDVKVGDQVAVTFKTDGAGSTQAELPILLNQDPYGDTKVDHPKSEGESSSEGHH